MFFRNTGFFGSHCGWSHIWVMNRKCEYGMESLHSKESCVYTNSTIPALAFCRLSYFHSERCCRLSIRACTGRGPPLPRHFLLAFGREALRSLTKKRNLDLLVVFKVGKLFHKRGVPTPFSFLVISGGGDNTQKFRCPFCWLSEEKPKKERNWDSNPQVNLRQADLY